MTCVKCKSYVANRLVKVGEVQYALCNGCSVKMGALPLRLTPELLATTPGRVVRGLVSLAGRQRLMARLLP